VHEYAHCVPLPAHPYTKTYSCVQSVVFVLSFLQINFYRCSLYLHALLLNILGKLSKNFELRATCSLRDYLMWPVSQSFIEIYTVSKTFNVYEEVILWDDLVLIANSHLTFCSFTSIITLNLLKDCHTFNHFPSLWCNSRSIPLLGVENHLPRGWPGVVGENWF